MTIQASTAAGEWRAHYMLPLAAALGYAFSVIHIYGLAPYVEHLEEAFGWTRTQVYFGQTISTVINGIFAIPIGFLVDRVGPRRVGLVGIVLTAGAFALLGTATGADLNWYMLWGTIALATLFVQATVWTSAVAGRFEASRGMALAVTLSGASVAQTVFPILAANLIEWAPRYGIDQADAWRVAFAFHALIWALVALPIVVLFFRGVRDINTKPQTASAAPPAPLTGVSVLEGMRSTVFLRLFIASALFTFIIIGLAGQFFLILRGNGVDPGAAAGIAGLIGVFSIIGRLGTGFLLDRFHAARVGAFIFLLPIIACVLLLFAGKDPVAQMAAAAVVGLTLGSEIDVIVYLTTRHFGLKNFGPIYGGILAALSIGTATGPLAAAAIFEATKNYSAFLMLTVAVMAIASLTLATLPRPPVFPGGDGSKAA